MKIYFQNALTGIPRSAILRPMQSTERWLSAGDKRGKKRKPGGIQGLAPGSPAPNTIGGSMALNKQQIMLASALSMLASQSFPQAFIIRSLPQPKLLRTKTETTADDAEAIAKAVAKRTRKNLKRLQCKSIGFVQT